VYTKDIYLNWTIISLVHSVNSLD